MILIPICFDLIMIHKLLIKFCLWFQFDFISVHKLLNFILISISFWLTSSRFSSDFNVILIHTLLNWFPFQFDLVCFWFTSFQFNSDDLNLIWFWISSSQYNYDSDLIGFDSKSQAFWFNSDSYSNLIHFDYHLQALDSVLILISIGFDLITIHKLLIQFWFWFQFDYISIHKLLILIMISVLLIDKLLIQLQF